MAAKAGGCVAAGIEGQHKYIVASAGLTGNVVLTPASLAGYSNITFSTIGDCVHLIYSASVWYIISNQGCALA